MSVRAARPEDLAEVVGLLGRLGLPVDGVPSHLDRFLVLEIGGRIVGAVGLEVYAGHFSAPSASRRSNRAEATAGVCIARSWRGPGS